MEASATEADSEAAVVTLERVVPDRRSERPCAACSPRPPGRSVRSPSSGSPGRRGPSRV